MFGLTLETIVILAVYGYVMCCVIKKGDMKLKGLVTAVVVVYVMSVKDGFSDKNLKNISKDLTKDVKKVEQGIKKYMDSSSIGNNRVVKGSQDTIGGGEMGAPIQAEWKADKHYETQKNQVVY